jgi:uncharacterized protein (TIGR02270 family)
LTGAEVSPARRPLALLDLVEESLDEAEFLWRVWERELDSPARDLAAVTFWVEDRLHGAIEGLRAGGEGAIVGLLGPALDAESPFRVTAAAHALAAEGGARAVEALAAAVDGADEAKQAGLARAIQLASSPPASRLQSALYSRGDAGRALLLDALAFQQRNPGAAALEAAWGAHHPLARAAAWRAARHLPPAVGARLGGPMADALAAPELVVRDAAAESGLILGLPAAWARSLELAQVPGPAGCRARLLVALVGTERDHPVLLAALADEASRHDALFALGFAGTRAAAEACVQAATIPPLARVAAESFAAITGVDLEGERLVAAPAPPADEAIPFEADDLDADLRPSPDDALPLPDAPGLARWWERQRGRFAAGQRYLGGQSSRAAALQAALQWGPMRRRHALALELSIRTGGRHQLQTRGFAREQRRQMQSFDPLGAGALAASPLAARFSPV